LTIIFIFIFRYLKIRSLHDLNADALQECLEACLKGENADLAIDLERVVGLAVDGASVMSGHVSGLVAKLRRVCSSLVHVHCIAHRLQLAIAKSSSAWAILDEEVEPLFSSLHTFFASHPQHIISLGEWQTQLQEPYLNVLKHVPTRWLSRFQVVDNFGRIDKSILNALSELAGNGNKSAATIFADLRKFSILAPIKHLNDILDELQKLSKFFQRTSVSFSQVAPLVEGLINVLERRYVSVSTPDDLKFGPKYNAFKKELPTFFRSIRVGTGLSSEFKYGGISCVKDMAEAGVALELADYVEALIENLRERFPKSVLDFWSNAACLDPDEIPDDLEQHPSYGGAQFYELVKHFRQHLQDSGIEVPTGPSGEAEIKRLWRDFLDRCRPFADAASTQWEELKAGLKAKADALKKKGKKAASTDPPVSKLAMFWSKVFKTELRLQCPLVCAVAMRVLVIPLSSVDCERGFSQQNLIRTKHRTSLDISTLDSHMRVLLVGPSMKMLSEPSFKAKFVAAVMRKWKTAKHCRFLSASQSNGRNSGATFHLSKEKPGSATSSRVQAGVSEQEELDLLNMCGDDAEDDEDEATLEAKYAAFGFDEFF